MNSTIFITGATGKVGGAALHHLLRNHDGEVIVGVRRPEAYTSGTDARVKVRRFDFDDLSTFGPALAEVNAALLLTGYSVDMLKHSVQFLDRAKAAGVGHVVHIGASGAPATEVTHWGWHRLIEAYIEKLGFTFTHLQPESYMQNVTGPGYRWLDGNTIKHYVGGAVWTWVDARDVGEVAAEALLMPKAHSGKTYRLGVEAKTFDQVAEILSSKARQTIRAEARTPEEFLATAVAGGADPVYMNSVYHQFQLEAEGKISGAGHIHTDVACVLRRPPVTWDAFASEWANGKSGE